ncbi:MAG: dTDP-glucose 4,6-dehydratase [Deltaproteobacteria bacterium]
MKTVLVTGGCGFIGSHFIRLLLAQTGFRVVNLDKLTYAGNPENLSDVETNPRYRLVRGDICDAALVYSVFRDEKPASVVNFAAESHVDRSILDPSPFIQTNVAGAQVLLEASKRLGVEKFLQISTDEVYGDADGRGPFDEQSPLHPSSPYSASKAAADLLCLAYARTWGLPVAIARSSNNYGAHQFPEKLIPLMIRNAASGAHLPVYGDGLQRRDWLFVEDNARALVKILVQAPAGEIYNVATGAETANLDAVNLICQILAEQSLFDSSALCELIRSVPDRPGHDRRYAVNIEKIRRDLGWSAEISFEQGLRRTVGWYLANPGWVQRVESGEYQSYCDAVYLRSWERDT